MTTPVKARVTDTLHDLLGENFTGSTLNLYAQIEDAFTVKLYNGTELEHSYKVSQNSKLELDNYIVPTKTGYIFNGWLIEGTTNYFDVFNDVVSANIVAIADFEIMKFDVLFDSMGGSFVDTIHNVEYGQTINIKSQKFNQ